MSFLVGLTLGFAVGVVGATIYWMNDLTRSFSETQKLMDREKEMKKIQRERDSVGYGAWFQPSLTPLPEGEVKE